MSNGPGPDHGNNEFNWDLDVNYDFDASVSLEASTDVCYDSYVDVDANIEVDVCIDGNLATFAIDVQAIGDDGSTELNLAVIVTDDYSSITATGYAAVA